jgi:hypothetical protein
MKEPDINVLAIRLDRLEEDCASQPQLVFLWGKELAAAKKRTAEAHNRMKLVAAEIGSEVRANPGRFGLMKVTEDGVKEAVLQTEDYRVAFDEHLVCEEEENILSAFVEALRDRRQMLTNEVSLHGQMYWAKPSVPTETERKRDMAEAGERVRRNSRK